MSDIIHHIKSNDIIAYPSISYLLCGFGFSIMVNNDGEVYVVGDNNNNCLGINTNNSVFPIEKVSSLSQYFIKMVSCGDHNSICLSQEGDVFTTGNNKYGQCGISPTEAYISSFQKIDIPPIEYIVSGGYFTICLTFEKTLYSFGKNEYGELGIGNSETQYTPQEIIDINDIEYIECGDTFVICKQYSGEYYAWGNNASYQIGLDKDTYFNKPTKCKNWSSDIISIKCGVEHSLFLTSNGKVYACGNKQNGKLGLGVDDNIQIPRLIENLPLIIKIEVGYHHSFCIDEEYNLWCFGWNNFGQLGVGDIKDRYEPTLNTEISNIIDISHGGSHTFIKTLDNDIYCFGYNDKHQLGLKNTVYSKNKPTKVFENMNVWKTIRKSRQKSARK